MTENNIRKDDIMEIDLGKLFHFYLGKWKVILFAGVLAAVIALGITFFAITPTYRASVTIYVNNTADGKNVSAVTGGDLTTAQKLVHTYVNIIKSDSVLDKVVEAGKFNVTAQGIREAMTASQIDDTEMFRVSISHADPKLAAELANTIADVAPRVISTFVEGSSTKIIDHAKVPENPYTPNYKRNIALGALVGVMLMGTFLTFKYLFDMRLQDEEDMERYFDAPVLGQIPTFVIDSYRAGSREVKAFKTRGAGKR